MKIRRTPLLAEWGFGTGIAPGGYTASVGSYGVSMIPQDPRKMAERRANAERRRARLREIASDWYTPSSPSRPCDAAAPRASSR